MRRVEIGDLVDDGLGNIGVIRRVTLAGDNHYLVHFLNPARTAHNGWYSVDDLKVISGNR